jgi:hypothetical protein
VLAALTANRAENLSDFVIPASSAGGVFGNIAFLSGERVESFTWNKKSYYLGELGWYSLFAFWVNQYFLLLPVVVVILGLLLAGALNRWLHEKLTARLALQDS